LSEERKEAVKELVSEGVSQRQIAKVIGVAERTVRRDRVAANDARDSKNPERKKTTSAANDAPKKPDAASSFRGRSAKHESPV
jgi:hypothetical protein